MLGLGWLFGVGHFAIANDWIQQPFDFQDAMPHWLGYVAVLLVSVYLAIYPMLAAGLAWRLASPAAKGDPAPAADAAFVLIAGAAWIVTEYLRGDDVHRLSVGPAVGGAGPRRSSRNRPG